MAGLNYSNWVTAKVLCGKEATISLMLLEELYPPGIPAIAAIKHWADALCKQLGCKATIHYGSDVITFYPTRVYP